MITPAGATPARSHDEFFRGSGSGRDDSLPYAYAAAYMNDALWIEAPKPDKKPQANP